MTYAEYLLTDHWKRLRRKKLEEAGYKCQRCESTYFLQVHHRFYRKSWFDTILQDLEAVCSYCHKKEHGILGVNDRPIYTFKQRQDIVGKLCPVRTPPPKPKYVKPKKQLQPKAKAKKIFDRILNGLSTVTIDRGIEDLKMLREEMANPT